MKLSENEERQLTLINAATKKGKGTILKGQAAFLHFQVFRKSIGGCPNCLDDAVILLLGLQKRLQAKKDDPSTVLLRNTIGFAFDGVLYNNSNLSEEIVRHFLAANPDQKWRFAILPNDLLDEVFVPELPEETSKDAKEEVVDSKTK